MAELEFDVKIPHLSPSKIANFVEYCGLKFAWEVEYRKEGIPIPVSGAMVLGTAIHSVVEWALKEVRAGRKLPSHQDMTDRLPRAWEEALAAEQAKKNPITWDKDDPEDQAIEEGKLVLPAAREQYLVGVRPRLVEEPMKEYIRWNGGEPILVWGRIDLVRDDADAPGGAEIVDWKTTKDSVSANQRKSGVQMYAYGWWFARCASVTHANVRKVFFVRGKRAKVETEPYQVTPGDMAYFERAAIMTWKAMRAQAFVPHEGWWCVSPKDKPYGCPFFDGCKRGQ